MLACLLAMPLLVWTTCVLESRVEHRINASYWSSLPNCALFVAGSLVKEVVTQQLHNRDIWATRWA